MSSGLSIRYTEHSIITIIPDHLQQPSQIFRVCRPTGRAGRVSNGRVYRLVPRTFYKDLPQYGIPEMQVRRFNRHMPYNCIYYIYIYEYFTVMYSLSLLIGLFCSQRSPLQQLILETKLLDMGEPKAILALALSPPALDDIQINVLQLKEVWPCY